MVFIFPETDSCVIQWTHENVMNVGHSMYSSAFFLWKMINLQYWNCQGNVPLGFLPLGCVITLKAITASIGDGLPYLPYTALRVIMHCIQIGQISYNNLKSLRILQNLQKSLIGDFANLYVGA